MIDFSGELIYSDTDELYKAIKNCSMKNKAEVSLTILIF